MWDLNVLDQVPVIVSASSVWKTVEEITGASVPSQVALHCSSAAVWFGVILLHGD